MPPGRVDSANSMRYGASADLLGQAVAGSVGETMTEISNEQPDSRVQVNE
jgi:hypothetical protein